MDEYNRREQAGELLYKPRRLDGRAKSLVVPSREQGRSIPCRVFTPASDRKIEGLLLNIHGGGWTVFSYKFQDPYLAHIADTNNLITICVGYQLAPNHPFPAGPEDCYDVAEWLVANSMSRFGTELSFIDGSVCIQLLTECVRLLTIRKSSGGHFAALTALHLRKSRPDFHLRGLVLKYGIFDLTYTNPSIVNAKNPIIVTHNALKYTTEAFVPGTTLKDRQNPKISPFYVDLQSLSPLPPALFVCGTEDILIDDSVFFAVKWMMVNCATVLKIFPGALHGFVDFDGMPFLQDGWDTITDFLASQV